MSESESKDEAHVVRFEIPPMMRYCAGTCPCTWVTAVALPNIAYIRQSLGIKRYKKEVEFDVQTVQSSVLSGEQKTEEMKYLEYLLPAQSLMGLSSYFAWYYGYGFYGPAKYPLLLYGLTLACHSASHEKDIIANPNSVLAHRAACTIGTFLCSCCFLRLSKLASLLILPACGVYACLTHVTMQGINGGNINRNAQNNVNNNQASDRQQRIEEQRNEAQSHPTSTHQPITPTNQPQRRGKKKRKAILKIEDVNGVNSNGQNHQRSARDRTKTLVSFNNTIGVKYRNPSLSTSISSSSLSSSIDNKDIVSCSRPTV